MFLIFAESFVPNMEHSSHVLESEPFGITVLMTMFKFLNTFFKMNVRLPECLSVSYGRPEKTIPEGNTKTGGSSPLSTAHCVSVLPGMP